MYVIFMHTQMMVGARIDNLRLCSGDSNYLNVTLLRLFAYVHIFTYINIHRLQDNQALCNDMLLLYTRAQLIHMYLCGYIRYTLYACININVAFIIIIVNVITNSLYQFSYMFSTYAINKHSIHKIYNNSFNPYINPYVFTFPPSYSAKKTP